VNLDDYRALAARWEKAADQARKVGSNPNTSPSKGQGEAAATTLIGCAQALRNLIGDE
jgi:hypothetical protein